MKKLIAVAVLGLSALSLAACTTDPVIGVVQDKYIENGSEYVVVVREDSTGYIHHIDVDLDDWRDLDKNEKFDSRNVDQETDD